MKSKANLDENRINFKKTQMIVDVTNQLQNLREIWRWRQVQKFGQENFILRKSSVEMSKRISSKNQMATPTAYKFQNYNFTPGLKVTSYRV